MKDQFRHGRLKFVSFILVDLLCLVLANIIAVLIYFNIHENSFRWTDYISIIIYMFFIDFIVTVLFNTLNRVMRRTIKKELLESIRHVIYSIVILALLLFSTKQGAEFSRLTVFFTYVIDVVLLILCRIGWKRILKLDRNNIQVPTALLITTSAYAAEGLEVVEKAGMAIKGLFITDRTNEGLVRNIPTIVDRQDAAAFLCWEWIDKVYVCGPDGIDVPESLLEACKQMGVPVYVAQAKKSFEYEVIKIRTALQKGDINTGLSFFEGEHDIPFRISRMYTIFEAEQENQKGYHAHKQSWHLLFCPYGSIDIRIDTGKERKTISLSDPSTGLLLHPSIWREMNWKKTGSVLCVAASGHYDSDKLRDDYNEYQRFIQEKEWSATIQSSEILGENIA